MERKQTDLEQSVCQPSKQTTLQETRELLAECQLSIEPKNLLDEARKILDKGIKAKKANKKERKAVETAMMILGHQKHYLVAESIVDESWRSMVMDLAECIQNEYECMGSSEIALAGLAAGSYYRSLRAARKMNALLEKTEIGMVGVHLMSQVSKEIERAERLYLSAIETLRDRRQPQMNVKVQTKAAFFGENQTFNSKPQEPYETNDPQ